MKPFSTQVRIDGNLMVAAGIPPFRVEAVGTMTWFVAGRDGCNCLAHLDGIRAVFDQHQPAVLLCQTLNERAA